eukprot:s570_g11.t2
MLPKVSHMSHRNNLVSVFLVLFLTGNPSSPVWIWNRAKPAFDGRVDLLKGPRNSRITILVTTFRAPKEQRQDARVMDSVGSSQAKHAASANTAEVSGRLWCRFRAGSARVRCGSGLFGDLRQHDWSRVIQWALRA